MPHPQAAYYMIEGKLEYLCQQLVKFPALVFWIHETVLANYLGISRSAKHGQGGAITPLLGCIKQGYGGNKKRGSYRATGLDGCFDLCEQGNAFQVCYQQFGDREAFGGGELDYDPK